MNNIVSISRDEERLEAATRWVLRIDEGILGADDKAALESWLDEDPKHSDVLMEVAVVWDKADALTALADLFPHEGIDRRAHSSAQRRPWAIGSAIAASLMLLTVSVTVLLPRLDKGDDNFSVISTQSKAYETAIGEQKTILLPDGSEVLLNTNSQLTLNFTASARVLHLTQGEILVRVAKGERPFSVVANNQIVQATGTEFIVSITKEQYVQVIVTEGSVVLGILPKTLLPHVVNNTNDISFRDPPEIAPIANNTLSAGEEVTLRGDGFVKETITEDNIKVSLSWTEQRLIFQSEPLEQVLREVERYTTVKFTILDENLKSQVLTGRFRTGDVDTLLLVLKENFSINYEFDGDNRVLISRL